MANCVRKKIDIFCINDCILGHFYLLFSPRKSLVNINKNTWHNTLLSPSWHKHTLLPKCGSITSSTDIIMLLPDMWKWKKLHAKNGYQNCSGNWTHISPLSLQASVIFCHFFHHLFSFLAWLKKLFKIINILSIKTTKLVI